jgi:hypothetical protein
VNVDEAAGIKEEDDPELTASTVIKTEPAVSLMSVYFQLYTRWTKSRNALVSVSYFA